MRIMLRAAIAALSFASINSAQAGEGERAAGISQFIQVPGQAIRPYVTASNHGTWLFTADPDGGANG